MKKKEEKREFLPMPRVALRSMQNCYLLDIDDEGYMYYGIDDLIEGFFMHVGLGRPNAMTKAQMDFMLDAIKDGSAVVQIQVRLLSASSVRSLTWPCYCREKRTQSSTSSCMVSLRTNYGSRLRGLALSVYWCVNMARK